MQMHRQLRALRDTSAAQCMYDFTGVDRWQRTDAALTAYARPPTSKTSFLVAVRRARGSHT